MPFPYWDLDPGSVTFGPGCAGEGALQRGGSESPASTSRNRKSADEAGARTSRDRGMSAVFRSGKRSRRAGSAGIVPRVPLGTGVGVQGSAVFVISQLEFLDSVNVSLIKYLFKVQRENKGHWGSNTCLDGLWRLTAQLSFWNFTAFSGVQGVD